MASSDLVIEPCVWAIWLKSTKTQKKLSNIEQITTKNFWKINACSRVMLSSSGNKFSSDTNLIFHDWTHRKSLGMPVTNSMRVSFISIAAYHDRVVNDKNECSPDNFYTRGQWFRLPRTTNS